MANLSLVSIVPLAYSLPDRRVKKIIRIEYSPIPVHDGMSGLCWAERQVCVSLGGGEPS
jgi:hypothetical protein